MQGPRLLFVAKPPPEVAAAMWMAAARNGLDNSPLFPRDNWHQSLSDRYLDTPEMRQTMQRAGACVKAQACTLVFNRIRDQVHKDRGQTTIHWTFRARGRPPCFQALLAAIELALYEQGLVTETGHTPHSTISYRAPARLGRIHMDPIAWTINEVLLVVGGNTQPYSYETIGRWPLQPMPPDPSSTQLQLF